jgi:broad specificity phosphatase PhoE
MRLYLITHAHTEAIPGAAADGWRLSRAGARQAAELARAPFWSEVQRIVVSSEPKTRLTVSDVLRERHLPVWVDVRFDELRRNGWVADYVAAVTAALEWPDVSHLGWEPASDALRRGLDGLAALQRRIPDEAVALVGHGLHLSLLRAHWLGQASVDPDEWARLPFAAVALVALPESRLLADFTFAEQARA